MARADEVSRLLREVGLPLDDDDIGSRLEINRHYVNAICRRLADQGLVERFDGPDGKLMTRAISSGTESLAPAGEVARSVAPRGRRSLRSRSDRARSNVDELILHFDECVALFEASEAFPGPSLYFHEQAIAVRRGHASAAEMVADHRFLEYVYAVLPAWGMHRMGKQAAKVGPFSEFAASIQSQVQSLSALWDLDIRNVAPTDEPDVSAAVWEVISSLRVSTSGTKIVAGSKTLHHLLPDLVPPIDRQYTFKFFTGQMQVNHGEATAFQEWFPFFCEIGRECRVGIDATLQGRGFMATGSAKVIDNAIMGFRQAQG